MSSETPLKETQDNQLMRMLRIRFDRFADPVHKIVAANGHIDLAGAEPLLQKLDDLIRIAPALVGRLATYPHLTKLLFGEQIESSSIRELPLDCAPSQTAKLFDELKLASHIAWANGPEGELPQIHNLLEDLLRHIHRRLQLSFCVLATGSFASDDLSPSAAAEIVLVSTTADSQRNDLEAHALLGFLEGLAHYGLTSKIEIKRINNALFVNDGGMSATEVANLAPTEFVAVSSARPIIGESVRIAEPIPLRPDRLKSLIAFKRQIETQLVSAKYRRRDVVNGEGGLGDLAWLLMLNEWRFPTATNRTALSFGSELGPISYGTAERLHNLHLAQLLLPNELDALLDAHRHLMAVQLRIQ
ncbi:MAG: hypothetical protein ABL962_11110, partial [Fimbriimonadaceae bacterium]